MEILNQYSGIIALIILIVVGCYLLTRKKDEVIEEVKEDKVVERVCCPLDVNDEDATVACLIASIDARQQTKKNMQVISVRRIG